MIHIKRSKNRQFYVVVTSENGEVLVQSETLKTKQAAWKNVRSLVSQLSGADLIVKDETLKTPLNYLFADVHDQST